MGTKHIHAEVIKAWADGAEIEFRFSRDGLWNPCKNNCPGWLEETQYRVKPKNIVINRRIEYYYDYKDTNTFTSPKPNLQLEFDAQGQLVSVEMIK